MATQSRRTTEQHPALGAPLSPRAAAVRFASADDSAPQERGKSPAYPLPAPQSPRRPHAQGHQQDDYSQAPPGCDAASCAVTSGPPQKNPTAPRVRHEECGEPRVPVSPRRQYLSPRSPQPRSCPSGPAKHRTQHLGRTPTPYCLCALSSFRSLRDVTSGGEASAMDNQSQADL